MREKRKQPAKVISVYQMIDVLSVLRKDDQLRFNNSNIVSILRNGFVVGVLDINSMSSRPIQGN